MTHSISISDNINWKDFIKIMKSSRCVIDSNLIYIFNKFDLFSLNDEYNQIFYDISISKYKKLRIYIGDYHNDMNSIKYFVVKKEYYNSKEQLHRISKPARIEYNSDGFIKAEHFVENNSTDKIITYFYDSDAKYPIIYVFHPLTNILHKRFHVGYLFERSSIVTNAEIAFRYEDKFNKQGILSYQLFIDIFPKFKNVAYSEFEVLFYQLTDEECKLMEMIIL